MFYGSPKYVRLTLYKIFVDPPFEHQSKLCIKARLAASRELLKGLPKADN